MHIAFFHQDMQAVGLHGIDVSRPLIDQHHIVPCLGQISTDAAADCTGTQYRHLFFHMNSSLVLFLQRCQPAGAGTAETRTAYSKLSSLAKLSGLITTRLPIPVWEKSARSAQKRMTYCDNNVFNNCLYQYILY